MNAKQHIYSVIGLCVLYGASVALLFFHELTLSELRKDFILGVHGVELIHTEGETGPRFHPWDPLEQNASLDSMLAKLCAEEHLADDCYHASWARFRIFTEEHWVTGPDGSSVILERNTVPIGPNDITVDLLATRLNYIAQWAKNTQRADGSFPYIYHPTTDTYIAGDYIIRQLLTVQGLFTAADVLRDPELASVALRAKDYLFRNYYRTKGANAAYLVDYDGTIPLGDTALALLMLRAHEGSTAPLSDIERRFAEHILSMQRSDGSFQTFLESATSTQDDKYYSGESLMALAMVDAVSPNVRYKEALQKGYEFYFAKLSNDFEPQYTPWHMQAYAIAYASSHNQEYADYVYWLADGLIETMLNHDTWALPDEVGRFFNPEYPTWGPPHSASTSIYLEGLTYAYETARLQHDTVREQKYLQAIRAGTRALLLVQWTPESAYYLPHPERAVGSFKVSITDTHGRIDQTGHSANALARVLAILQEGEIGQ